MSSITPEMIGWGRYGSTEGPYFKGTISYNLPKNPGFLDKCIAVLSSTEGKMDSVNMYDSCIVSTSMIQLCERFNLTSILLGRVADKCEYNAVGSPFADAMRISNCDFKSDEAGRWRFHFFDSRGVVDTLAKKRELFLGCSGTVGTWTPEARQHAKIWASALATVWQNPKAQAVQIDYIKGTLMSYVMKESRAALFTDAVEKRSVGMIGATRAVFISFAANNPKRANSMLIEYLNETQLEKWSNDWCIGLMKKLTFGPKIKIYPHRYDAIVKVVEKLFGVELPPSSQELSEWEPKQRDEEKLEELEPIDEHTADEKEIVKVDSSEKEKEIEKIIPWRPPEGPSFMGFLKWLFAMIAAFFTGDKK